MISLQWDSQQLLYSRSQEHLWLEPIMDLQSEDQPNQRRLFTHRNLRTWFNLPRFTLSEEDQDNPLLINLAPIAVPFIILPDILDPRPIPQTNISPILMEVPTILKYQVESEAETLRMLDGRRVKNGPRSETMLSD